PSAISGTFNNLPENAGVVFGDFAGMITYVGGDEGKDVVLVPDTINPVAVCQDIILPVGVNGITVTGDQLDGGSTDNGLVSEFLINGQPSLDFTLTDFDENDVTITVIDAAGNTDQCDATITLVSNVNTTLPILISEYQPITFDSNVPQTIELKGEPGESFIGTFVIIDGDNSRNGRGVVTDATDISGVFNGDGILTVSIPNVTNPSHTAVLTSAFSGTVDVTDIDDDNDGVADDLSSFGTFFDAVGVSDGGACCPLDVLYGADFGGVNLPSIGANPSAIFREGSVGDFYQISTSSDVIYNTNGDVVDPLLFNLFPTDNGTFGDINPSVTKTSTDIFITTWKTDNPGTSDDLTIEIPTLGSGYDYIVDWGDGTIDNGLTTNASHTYSTIDTYTVRITGDFPRIRFSSGTDREKIETVEQWGHIQWTSMESAFSGCENLQIMASDAPDLSQVTNMSGMFASCESFVGDNTDLNLWDVSNVENMQFLFGQATNFNAPLDNWNVSAVTNMAGMFLLATNFNQDISSWNVSSVETMELMFLQAEKFNQPLNSWNVANVIEMESMFEGATDFNQPLNSWNVTAVLDMRQMFSGATNFNQPLNNWNVSGVERMSGMFSNAQSFNQNINNWTIGPVVDSLNGMFSGASSFNQPLNNWNVSAVTSMFSMFSGASSFNQPLNNWNVGAAVGMAFMFRDATSFNQPLDNWDVSSVTQMQSMFEGATSFDQNLGSWDISSVNFIFEMFNGVTLSTQNYDNTLIGWATLEAGETQIPSIDNNFGDFSGGNSQYCLSEAKRLELINTYGWSIIDGGLNCPTTVSLRPKVYLQGAALNPNAGEDNLMRDDLRVAGLLPTTSPYADGLTTTFSTGEPNNNIVDWVWVELRDKTDNTIIIEGQSALLQRDGDVINTNGNGSLTFTVPTDDYYVVIKHRNHLGIMSSSAITLSSNVTTTVDFTNGSVSTFGTDAQTTFGMPVGIQAMWAGDANSDGIVQYSGGFPDTPGILSFVLNDGANFLGLPTHVASGYSNNDINMDGNTQYTGANPELPFILQNVISYPGNFLGLSTWPIEEQLPDPDAMARYMPRRNQFENSKF
ncbi:MAG: BspA family leucine-rich repeat surface protein, partial [Bacteroidota bacterium]